ncbi:MFS transporter [Paenibacillus thalictri]|uniref:MFS transporter n=1 Tax=Paenibacillus thalictri TaxID=2527873 RepID=A0A4Q9DDB6_9BACL|nr:MFS transporter [Paenibacillus thalictri]TBL69083.1 MFS transporter [Paenibacillus thalictri]
MSKSKRNPNAILAIILASTMMVVMDVSIVTTSLPVIHKQFGFSPVGLSWVVNVYSLVFGGLLLLSSRAGDLFGRRRMFMVGLSIFTFASLAIGLAQSAEMLIIFRAIQGLGASILSPATLALLTENFKEGHERTRVLALYGTIVGIATSVGLVLGGIVTSLISWRVAFFLNVPIGLITLWATPRFIAKTQSYKGKLDVIGAILSVFGMSSLVYGIVHAADTSWSNSVTVMMLAVGVVLLAVFVVNEWRARQPIMPLRLFQHRGRAASYAARTLYLGVMISFWFFITQYLQVVKGFSPILTGVAFLPMTLANFFAALYIPRLTRRIGNPLIITLGVGVTVVGMFWISQITPSSSYLLMFALPLILLGIGQGLSQGPLTAEGLAGVYDRDAGAASGITYVASQLGAAFGLAILVAIFAAASTSTLSGNALLTHQISAALFGAGIILVASLFIVVVWIVFRRERLNNTEIDEEYTK